jgi:serine/threonine protein kinase
VTDTTTTRAGGSPCPDDVILGRYRLVDRVGDTAGTTVWHGYDERLARAVSLRFAPLDSAVAEVLREAAIRASRVSDRRAVAVLDVIDDVESGQLVVVSEWLRGTAFGDYLAARRGDPLPPREAATLALEVARFLAAAEAADVTHGRVRPNAVIVTDSGEVRVRGLAVDQALHGSELGIDPRLADVHGAGAVLYAGLTGRWPGDLDAEHLPGVPAVSGGRTPWPSRVVADVPADLDEIAARAVQTTNPPKGLGHFSSVADVEAALASSLVAAPAPPVRRSWARPLLRAVAVATAVLAAIGLAGLGVGMIRGLGGSPLVVARGGNDPSQAPSSTPGTKPSTAGETLLPIVSVRDFDPLGNASENPALAPLAIDADPVSAWRTVSYKRPNLSGKPGVGLLLDLGAPRPVDAVTLRLVGVGTSLSVLATDDPSKPVATFTTLAEVTKAGAVLPLRVPRSVTTRYVVIWITGLPSVDGRYQGGIADVRVLG